MLPPAKPSQGNSVLTGQLWAPHGSCLSPQRAQHCFKPVREPSQTQGRDKDVTSQGEEYHRISSTIFLSLLGSRALSHIHEHMLFYWLLLGVSFVCGILLTS